MASLVFYVTVACSLTLALADMEEVPFTSCNTAAVSPSEVRVNCSSLVRGVCVLTKGQTYSIQADFTPEVSAERVESSVAWKTWVEMPLLGQNPNACLARQLRCPLEDGDSTTFTYPLHVPTYWMRRRYPLVWRLKDQTSNNLLLCFNLRVQIVS